MFRQIPTAVFLACLTTIPHLTNAQDNSSKQIGISIRLCERVTETSLVKTLANPTIVAVVGQAFSMHSGGTVKPRVGEGELEFGTRVTGELNYSGNNMVQVALKIRIATHREIDAKTDMILTETLDIRTMLKPGKMKRLECSQSRWCEVRIEEVDIPALSKGQAKLSEGDIFTVTFSEKYALLLHGEQPDKQLGPLEPSLYRMAVMVTGIRPNGVYEIESHQKTKLDDVLREMSLTGLVQAASVSDKRTVVIDEVMNLDVNVCVIKTSK